jgi:hypothetical protein
MTKRPYVVTKRTFICKDGLFKARSLADAIQRADGYRVRLLDRTLYHNGVVLMAVNLSTRVVYFQFADTESSAYRCLFPVR